MKWWTCVVLFCVTAVLADGDWRDVTIAQGSVRGHKHPSADLYAFYNIPYATAPVGESKFKPPQPAPTWSETFEATGPKSVVCPQHREMIDLLGDAVEMKDDCLIAWLDDLLGRNVTVTPEFVEMRATVRELWHNFMKTGRPVPEGSSLLPWPAARANRSPYMVLDSELTQGGVLLESSTRFWEEIYEKHYRDAIPPRSGVGSMAPQNMFNLFMLSIVLYLTETITV